MSVTSQLVNEPPASDFGIFCNPESRRAEGFSIALARNWHQRPKLIPWQWVLEGVDWGKRLQPVPKFLRLESPGRNWPVEKLLLSRGVAVEDEETARSWRHIPAERIAALSNEPGRVWPMRQWFLGWRQILEHLNSWATAGGLSSRWLCPPSDVICMFDKYACQKRLEEAGMPVPPMLGIPRNFEELWDLMHRHGRRRVFLKPCHGSSASGVVALESNRNEIQAFSTIEQRREGEGIHLYNHRQIKVWRGVADVRQLVDTVCGERCLAQVWIPKAGICGRPFDLRVVVIGRRARHVMVRLGKGPMTNSQLLGGKGDPEMLRRKMGNEAWENMLKLCEQAMGKCFPRSLYAGFDVLIEPDFRTARILEVNAFGDLLPGILHEARDTYSAEIEEVLRQTHQVCASGA